MSLVARKPVFTWCFHLERHKPVLTATEDGYRLEIFYLETIGIIT